MEEGSRRSWCAHAGARDGGTPRLTQPPRRPGEGHCPPGPGAGARAGGVGGPDRSQSRHHPGAGRGHPSHPRLRQRGLGHVQRLSPACERAGADHREHRDVCPAGSQPRHSGRISGNLKVLFTFYVYQNTNLYRKNK